MNTTEQILLVILGAALAVFLTLAIVAIVYVIRLIKTLQTLAEKAETLVESAESVGAMVKQAVGQLSLLKFLRSIVTLVHNKGK
jgi:ABC-type methionine transport system permease subunit